MHLMLADNGQQRAFVTGTEIAFDSKRHNLAAENVAVFIDGELRDRASGSAVMDSGPLTSLAWLANKLADYNRAIEPGHVVMSGSFTRQFKIDGPIAIEARFSTFGAVTARFT
jgi:2-keto-4-pentenoate hydratase